MDSVCVGGDEAGPASEKENGKASTSKQDKEDNVEIEEKKVKEEEESVAALVQEEDDLVMVKKQRPTIVLHSQKMKELKDLLLAEKLNTHAISLHLTAQSQVQVGKKGRNDDGGNGMRPKRARRD